MNITEKIIITDTNIITDLSNAGILEKFIELDNVFVSDLVMNDEFNSNTCNEHILKKMKTIEFTAIQMIELEKLQKTTNKLSQYDLINYITARDCRWILATGDKRLKDYSEKNGVLVIRTLKIIEMLSSDSIITYKEAMNACALLKICKDTRIPIESIDDFMNKLMYKYLLIENILQ